MGKEENRDREREREREKMNKCPNVGGIDLLLRWDVPVFRETETDRGV